jgi:hypothetical protein
VSDEKRYIMKYLFVILTFVFPLSAGASCDFIHESESPQIKDEEPKPPMSTNIKIKIGDKYFTATFSDNATTKALMAMLPLTVSMTELNGNEKFFRLSKNLPTNTSNPGSIAIGDLMLWGSNTLVLFYKNFSTSYDYTRLGKIDNPTELAAALGAGNVIVTFEME